MALLFNETTTSLHREDIKQLEVDDLATENSHFLRLVELGKLKSKSN